MKITSTNLSREQRLRQATHYVYGGGTMFHVRAHFDLFPDMNLGVWAAGTTAHQIHTLLQDEGLHSVLRLTKMTGSNRGLCTNNDVQEDLDGVKKNLMAGIVFFNVALTDWIGQIDDVPAGRHAERLETRGDEPVTMTLTPAPKIIPTIRENRRDIYVVGFKTTCNASREEMYEKGIRLLKEGHVNLVLVNDIATYLNMVVVPEEAIYAETTDRCFALQELVKIATARYGLTFTRSTVVKSARVAWKSPDVPDNLRRVVDHCIKRRAYKPFRGKTAGHFAVKVGDDEFLTSVRNDNFNLLPEKGLVRVFAEGADSVVAYGAKPSVGGQSQRIIFKDHQDKRLDCIVHFHCPMKEGSQVNVVPQWMFECGSHECGKNTSDGLRYHGDGIYAVMLENHGPNIVFNRNVPWEKVVAFIEANFDLSQKTGGLFVTPVSQAA